MDAADPKVITVTQREMSRSLKPFLRWPGGKRWLVAAQPLLFNFEFGNYFEPFLGAGSVFFHLLPHSATLTDRNSELIAAYRGIREAPATVFALLAEHAANHDEDYYYLVRDLEMESDTERAARLLYLNRTCFNGIYRVNRLGMFNVPIGDRRNLPGTLNDLVRTSTSLQNASLLACDFLCTLDKVDAGDLVYLDPPYTVMHNENGFVRYNDTLFTWDDQLRLAGFAERAVERGAHVVLTNAHHTSIVTLYARSGLFDLAPVNRFSGVAAASGNRRSSTELLVISKHTQLARSRQL